MNGGLFIVINAGEWDMIQRNVRGYWELGRNRYLKLESKGGIRER